MMCICWCRCRCVWTTYTMGTQQTSRRSCRSSRRSRRDVVGPTALWVTWTENLRICGVSGGSRGGRDADLGGFVFFLGKKSMKNGCEIFEIHSYNCWFMLLCHFVWNSFFEMNSFSPRKIPNGWKMIHFLLGLNRPIFRSFYCSFKGG